MPLRLPTAKQPPATPSGVAVLAAIVAVVAFATAAILFVSDSSASTERLALFFALLGVIVPALIASLKSDQAAQQTNGKLDQRIHDAVTVAMANRAAESPQDRHDDALVASIGRGK